MHSYISGLHSMTFLLNGCKPYKPCLSCLYCVILVLRHSLLIMDFWNRNKYYSVLWFLALPQRVRP